MEIQNYLNTNTHLSKNTLKAYNNNYNRLINSGLFTYQLQDTKQSKILEYIETITDNNNVISSLLNICIVLKKFNNKDYSKLLDYRNKLKLLLEEDKKQSNITLTETLPNYSIINKWIDDLYKDGKYLDFVINYIIFNFNTRNKDIDLIIVNHTKFLTDDDNYLLMRKNDCVLYRNIYKTSSTFGKLKNVIKSAKFLDAINSLNIENGSPLLQKNNKRITDEQLHYFIQSKTYNGLGEGNYTKINLIKNNGNSNGLKRISNNRGTSIDTLINHYSIDNI
jgi:hypothetical protein